MEFDDVIYSRRTCTDYKSKDLPMEKIAEVLEIARFAPSSANIQNWQFIIVRDQNKREKISDICKEQVWMADAPVHIVICNKKEEVEKDFEEKGERYSTQNCAIIAGNIILKANDLGLGSAIVGAFDDYELKKLLDIPDKVIPEMIITLGYPNSLDEDQTRDELKYLSYFESWGKKEDKKDFWPVSKHLKKLGTKTTQAKNLAKLKTSSVTRKIKNKLKK